MFALPRAHTNTETHTHVRHICTARAPFQFEIDRQPGLATCAFCKGKGPWVRDDPVYNSKSYDTLLCTTCFSLTGFSIQCCYRCRHLFYCMMRDQTDIIDTKRHFIRNALYRDPVLSLDVLTGMSRKGLYSCTACQTVVLIVSDSLARADLRRDRQERPCQLIRCVPGGRGQSQSAQLGARP